MELRVLHYFLTVAKVGSISGAAKILFVTQPTLSRQLMDLEEELGKKLFIRSNRQISLTNDGILLRKRAEEIMSLVNKTHSEFKPSTSGIAGDIYIGAGESYVMTHVVKIMKEIHEQYPKVNFNLYSGNAEDVIERLDRGMLDFGVLVQPVDISKYDYITLPQKDLWGVIMREDHTLSQKKSLTKEDLLHEPLLCTRRQIRLVQVKNAYMEWFGEDWENLNVVATYNLMYNALLMVKAGMGIALILDKLADVSVISGLCFRPLEPRLESALTIVWKKHQVFSEAAEIFRRNIIQHFGSNNN